MKNASRRVLAVLLCLAMMAGYLGYIPIPATTATAVETEPANPNLLTNNPDFEKVNDIAGWTVSDKTAVFQSNTVVSGDKLSLKIKDASSSGINYARSAKVAVAAGEVYYASAEVYGTTHGTITVRFYDSNGKEMTDKTVTKTTATPKTQWQSLLAEMVAPEGAVKAEVELSTTNKGVGEVYFDNVAFYAEPGAARVENSSFEGSFDNTLNIPEGWTGWGGRSPLRQLNTNLSYVHKGTQSLKLDVNIDPTTGRNTTIGVRSSKIDAIVGSRYAYSFWVKSEDFGDAKSVCYAYVNFYNAAGTILDLKGNEIASNKFSYSKEFSVSTSWQKITDGVVAPTGAVKAEVLVLTCSATKAAVYLDEITLKLDTSIPVLENGSFEEGAQENGIPVSWAYYGAPSNSTLVTNTKTDGSYAVKIDNTSDQAHSGIRMWLPVRKGEVWKLSADQKGEVQVYLQYYTADKSTRTSSIRAEANAKETGWQSVECTLEAETTVNGVPGMMQILIYISASTPGVSYVDNVKLERVSAAPIPTIANQLTNGDFEDRKAVTEWPKMDFDYIQSDEHAGGDRGNFVVKFTDDDTKSAKQFTSARYPVTPAKYYYAMVDCLADTEVQVYIRFYDADGQRIMPTTFNTAADTKGQWQRVGALSRAPDNAATVEMLFGTTVTATGTAYCDNLYLGEYNVEKDPDIPGMNSIKSPGWDDVNFDEVGHPRVFFTADELTKLQKSVSYGFENDFGYSLRESYKELLEQADTYVKEKTLRMVWQEIELIYDLDDFTDINDLEEIKNPPKNYTSGVYPFFTHIGEQLQERMQVLALAYAISEKEEYAERAIHYAMRLCDWRIWSQADAVKTAATDMGCSYVTQSAAIIYDMCYDKLTDAQRVKLYTNIVEKGLKPLNRDVEALTNHNVWLARVNGILTAASAIIEESNRDLVEPYLTAGYRYSEWYLDELYESGWQEGYSYTDHALESVITGIDAMGRATGKKGFMDHPYFTEILTDWLIYGMAPGSGISPAFSDSSPTHYFFKTMMLLNKTTGNEKAGFYLKESGIIETATAFERLLYTNPEPKIAERKDLYQTTTVVDEIGYGFLRSGWGALDMTLSMVSNDSQHDHNHYDQNAINLAFNSMDMMADYGYAALGGSREAPGYLFGVWTGHNVVFVDGEPQSVKGNGTMTEVVGNSLYGHIKGSAADAYGGRLTQADRHAILLNHWDKPYYVIIDELDSDTKHVYNWNLYTRGWNGLQFADKAADVGSTAMINQFAVTKDRDAMFITFVGNEALEVKAFEAHDTYPVVQTNSPSTQRYQFMAVINTEAEVCKDAVIDFNSLFRGYLYGQTNRPTDKVLWSTSYKGGSEVVKKVQVEGNDCVFFRGSAVGDYYEMTFEVEFGGTYNVKLSMPTSPNYGNYKIYLDGEPCEEIFEGYGPSVRMTNYDVGLMDVAAGTHTIRLELVGKDKNSDDYLISCGGVILADPNKPAAVSTVNVVETYDDENVLGATIRYGNVLKDVVLYNRGNGIIAGGNVTTDGSQATIMGIYESEITEGFSVVNGTSLKFGNTLLMQSTGAVTVAVDYRAVKQQIENSDDVLTEYEEEEDIDRGIPTTYVNTNAAAACSVTINVGNDFPYTVTIDGVQVASTYENGYLTLDVPAGNHDVVIVGTHTCQFTQKVEAIMHMCSAANCNSPALFYYSCICGENGPETFQVGQARAHNWGTSKDGTAATCDQAGTKVYKCRSCSEIKSEEIPATGHTLVASGSFFACSVCGKQFVDAEGKMEVNTLITLIIIGAVAVVVLAGGIILFVILKKRKRNKSAAAEQPEAQSDDQAEDQTAEE